MRHIRPHWKVLLWWGPWWAIQIMLMPEIAIGMRIEWRRPLLDIYLGPITLAFGNDPIRTDAWQGQRNCCRGFIVSGTPEMAAL